MYYCVIQSVWIVATWQCVSSEVIVRCFKKCCISIGMDGTDGDVLWSGREEDGNFES